MDIEKPKSPKHALHAFLFCLSATLSMCFFIFLIIVTSSVLWLTVPSSLIYGFSFTVFMALFSWIFVLARRRKRPGLVAVSLGAMSAPVMLLALAMIGALFRTKPDQPVNRRQPSTSPSGKYVLTVPIERARRPGLPRFGRPYWHVTISDPNGTVLYRDLQEQFPGWFGAYWVWDKEDRVWIFSYDEGTVFFECVDGVWTRYKWSPNDKGYKQRGISPPGLLYPKRRNQHSPGSTSGDIRQPRSGGASPSLPPAHHVPSPTSGSRRSGLVLAGAFLERHWPAAADDIAYAG